MHLYFSRIFIFLIVLHVKLSIPYNAHSSSVSLGEKTLDTYPEVCRKLFDNNGKITHSFREVFEEMKSPKISPDLLESFNLVQTIFTPGCEKEIGLILKQIMA